MAVKKLFGVDEKVENEIDERISVFAGDSSMIEAAFSKYVDDTIDPKVSEILGLIFGYIVGVPLDVLSKSLSEYNEASEFLEDLAPFFDQLAEGSQTFVLQK